MFFCQGCGTQVIEQGKYCHNCGVESQNGGLVKLYKFITGSDSFTPLGLERAITVRFIHWCARDYKCRPTASTCDPSINLPVHYNNISSFEKAMTSAVKEGLVSDKIDQSCPCTNNPDQRSQLLSISAIFSFGTVTEQSKAADCSGTAGDLHAKVDQLIQQVSLMMHQMDQLSAAFAKFAKCKVCIKKRYKSIDDPEDRQSVVKTPPGPPAFTPAPTSAPAPAPVAPFVPPLAMPDQVKKVKSLPIQKQTGQSAEDTVTMLIGSPSKK
ncbi:hypothetical protein OS493_007118 [Desmophyllum pertusum]|uniref:Zinc-ribbon domain-containing protein n=1 Tax=Desmophyllum pertusum TaxID=174260 RepID=A0A9X0CYZ7_9CNID|nr:hypothetical protein OS493_007118 [Desmophyllum pertusum]